MASIQKIERRKGTVYKVWWRDPQGRVRTKTFDRKRVADAFVAEVESSKHAGTYRDPALGRITLAELTDQFVTEGKVGPNTLTLYAGQLRRHVLPPLGHRQVASIAADDIAAVLKGLSPATADQVHRILRRLLNFAVERGRIGVNPAARLGMARPKRREQRYLAASQVRELAEESGAPLLILTLAFTGLRIGEAAALRRRSVDLDRGVLHVTEAFADIGGRMVLGRPKSGRSRAVKLPAFLVAEFKVFEGKHTDEFLFTSPGGGVLRHNNFRRRVFQPAAERVGLGDLHVHDLRHTAVAFAIQSGAHPKAIQEMCGHASITTTLDVYGHLFPTLQDQIAEGMDRLYMNLP